jgi:hypothetical protein
MSGPYCRRTDWGRHFVYRTRILLYSEASSGVLGIGSAASDCRSLDPAIEFGLAITREENLDPR